jgi:hypothetical protein
VKAAPCRQPEYEKIALIARRYLPVPPNWIYTLEGGPNRGSAKAWLFISKSVRGENPLVSEGAALKPVARFDDREHHLNRSVRPGVHGCCVIAVTGDGGPRRLCANEILAFRA